MGMSSSQLQRDRLTALLRQLSADLLGSEWEMLTAGDDAQFRAAAHKAAAKIAAASAGWTIVAASLRNHGRDPAMISTPAT
jgi:hypothetical protein